MTITNKLGLPDPLVRAVTNDSYKSGRSDYTATSLIAPPRQRALMKLHAEELTEDASDRLWSLCGQIGHLILERAADKSISEKRLYAKVGGKTIGGQMDLIELPGGEIELFDYKFTSIWTVMDGMKPEWEQQLNIYNFLLWENSIPLRSANIVAIFRDWSKSKASREEKYPQQQVRVLPVKLWPLETTRAYILLRIGHHESALKELPECTAEERWCDPDKWAVKKKGNKRALRVFEHEAEAIAMAKEAGREGGLVIEERKGISKRCQDYCAVSEFCDQWKALKAQEEAE